MKFAGSSIRFSGSVCGGLHTYGSLTFRTVGTAVVVASPSTERLMVAKSGKVYDLDATAWRESQCTRDLQVNLGQLPGMHALRYQSKNCSTVGLLP